jgi:hypothetical protein
MSINDPVIYSNKLLPTIHSIHRLSFLNTSALSDRFVRQHNRKYVEQVNLRFQVTYRYLAYQLTRTIVLRRDYRSTLNIHSRGSYRIERMSMFQDDCRRLDMSTSTVYLDVDFLEHTHTHTHTRTSNDITCSHDFIGRCR